MSSGLHPALKQDSLDCGDIKTVLIDISERLHRIESNLTVALSYMHSLSLRLGTVEAWNSACPNDCPHRIVETKVKGQS